MSWTAGEVLNSLTRLRRLSESIPDAYSLWKDGSIYRAECNVAAGSDYSGANFATVLLNALAESSGAAVRLKGNTIYTVAAGSPGVPAIPLPHGDAAIRGEGANTKIQLDPSASYNNVTMFSTNSKNNIIFENLQLDGNRTGTPPAPNADPAYSHGIMVADGSQNIFINNVWSHNFKDNGIVTTGIPRVSHIFVTNYHGWYNGRQGLYFSDAQRCLACNVICNDNGWFGLKVGTTPALSDAPKSVISNSIFYDNDIDGIRNDSDDVVYSNIQSFSTSDTYATKQYYGINHDDGSNCTYANCETINNRMGIVIAYGGVGSVGNQILGHKSVGEYRGIHLCGAQHSLVDAFSIRDPFYHVTDAPDPIGILLENSSVSAAKYNMVSNGRIFDTRGTPRLYRGIIVTGTVTYKGEKNKIFNNGIYNATNEGIHSGDTNVDNELRGNYGECPANTLLSENWGTVQVADDGTITHNLIGDPSDQYGYIFLSLNAGDTVADSITWQANSATITVHHGQAGTPYISWFAKRMYI